MSTEIKNLDDKDNNDKRTESILITEENINLMNESYKKFNSMIYSNEELNKFKDNILSLLKERDKLYIRKHLEYKTKTEKIQTDFKHSINLTHINFNKIIETQAKITSRLDQLDNYESFVSKTNDKLVSHEVRLNNLRDDFSYSTQKYDKIYLDNLELPGFIGRCAKYKNCQNFFLDIIQDLAKLNKYKEKSIIDLKMYKDKLETIISSMNSILDNNNTSQIRYINETKEKILKDCDKMFESIRENMKEIRVENSKYSVELISKSMELTKKWDKIETIKNDLLERFNYSINKYQMMTEDTIKSFEEFKKEYSIIRRKFMELAEFIKDVRFRKNIGENVKKKEIKEIVKKILKKRRSFDAKDIQLLTDISNIENMDYKNFEEKNDENNNENRSLTLNHNDKSRKRNNISSIKKKNSHKILKEIIYKKALNQSAEGSKIQKMNIKNPLNSNENNNDTFNPNSINITPINISKNKSKISEIVYNINNNYINSNKNDNNFDRKKSNDLPNISNKKEKEKNKKLIEKMKKEKNNEIIINDYNNRQIEINQNKNKSMNIKEESYNKNKPIENVLKIEEKRQNINKEQINNEKNIKLDIIGNNKSNENSQKKEISNQFTGNNNIVKCDEVSQKSLSRIMSFKSNTEIKPTLNEETSTISDINNVNNSVQNNKNNNIGLSSEKSFSFISDKNLNRFLINEVQLGPNDKIIKELASELEQSTAKKEKLASNKKEIEKKFKKVCSNIEPINLLVKKEKSIKIDCNPIENSNFNKEQNINDNYKNEFQTNKILEEGDNTFNNILINNKNFNDLNNNNLIYDNNNINNNNKNGNNNEYINALNPIRTNNEVIINETYNTSIFNKKFHAYDQKLLNLELYTKEKILDLIAQINLLKKIYNPAINDSFFSEKSYLDSNKKSSNIRNKTQPGGKFKNFNNSYFSNSNYKNQNSPFNIEKNKENIPNNINSNCQNLFGYSNFGKKRNSLKNGKSANTKSSLINSKIPKNNFNSIHFNNIKNNNLNENNNNGILMNSVKSDNIKEIIDGNVVKNSQNNNNKNIIQKFSKNEEKRAESCKGNMLKYNNSNFNENVNNKNLDNNLNIGSSRNNFAYSSSSFKGTEIRLVDLNKLVNQQLPRNNLYPVNIMEKDYFVALNTK